MIFHFYAVHNPSPVTPDQVVLEPSSAAPPRQALTLPEIRELHGAVTPENFERFEAFVSDNMDRVVGLKVWFDAEEIKKKGLITSVNREQFATYLHGGTAEIVANDGYAYRQGNYIFDGFFVVKNGGMHQGVISYGLILAREETIRLSGSTILKEELR